VPRWYSLHKGNIFHKFVMNLSWSVSSTSIPQEGWVRAVPRATRTSYPLGRTAEGLEFRYSEGKSLRTWKVCRTTAIQSQFNIGQNSELTGPRYQSTIHKHRSQKLGLSISETFYRHTLQSTRMLRITRGEEKDLSHQSCLKKFLMSSDTSLPWLSQVRQQSSRHINADGHIF